MRVPQVVLALSLLSLPRIAHAHFDLVAPPPSTTSTDGGKGLPPCGPDNSSATITEVQGGHPLKLQIKETVFHPGFYRVALSLQSRSELPLDNVVKDSMGNVLSPTGTSGQSETADYETTPVFPVLADHLFPHTTSQATFETMITLPNVTCARCTLQVIEFMAKHGPNNIPTVGGGYFYHHCADLKITADPGMPAFMPGSGGAGGASNGGASGAAGSSSGGSAGSPSAGSNSAGSGGTAGLSAVAGAPSAGSNASAGAPTTAGSSAGGASSGGSSNSAGNSNAAGTSAAGASASGDANDGGGCSFAPGTSGTRPLWFALFGLLVLGRRRRARHAA